MGEFCTALITTKVLWSMWTIRVISIFFIQ